MSLKIQKEEKNVLHVAVSGKLTKADYKRFVPVTEELIRKHGKIRVLLETHNFRGWEAGALWEDIKFDAKHFNDIERLAIVGERAWEHGMAVFCRPFTMAQVRYFEKDQAADARAWIKSEPTGSGAAPADVEEARELEEAVASDPSVERGERIQTAKTIARGGQAEGSVAGATEFPAEEHGFSTTAEYPS